ncbi:MAG: hypothetical protein HYU88_01265 [Chloroflexi bacterium]|nr:hypothetical protein [Chloroflexota bacterium]
MTGRPVILIPDRLEQPADVEQEAFGPAARILTPGAHHDAEIADEVWASADAVLAWHDLRYPAALLAKLRRCRVIVRIGVGYDNVDLEAAGRLGIAVCNVPDYGTADVADHAMALLLALARGVYAFSERVRAADDNWHWQAAGPLRRLAGSTLGIVGLGRIGTAVALRAKAFGMRVAFYDPYLPDGQDKALGVERCDALDELLGQADAVSIHTPLTDETRGMADGGRRRVLRHAEGGCALRQHGARADRRPRRAGRGLARRAAARGRPRRAAAGAAGPGAPAHQGLARRRALGRSPADHHAARRVLHRRVVPRAAREGRSGGHACPRLLRVTDLRQQAEVSRERARLALRRWRTRTRNLREVEDGARDSGERRQGDRSPRAPAGARARRRALRAHLRPAARRAEGAPCRRALLHHRQRTLAHDARPDAAGRREEVRHEHVPAASAPGCYAPRLLLRVGPDSLAGQRWLPGRVEGGVPSPAALPLLLREGMRADLPAHAAASGP